MKILFDKLVSRLMFLRVFVIAVCIMHSPLTVQPAAAALIGEIVERLVVQSGRGPLIDKAAKASMERSLVAAFKKFGEKEVVALTHKGGSALVEAAEKYGDEIWRLARLADDVPVALAARPAEMLALASKWGDAAVLLEARVPGSAGLLVPHISGASMSRLSYEATPNEIKRLLALAKNGGPDSTKAGYNLWKYGGEKTLEKFTPARIAASGLATSMVIVAWQAPVAMIGVAESAFTGLLGPTVLVVSWSLAVAVGMLLFRPLYWLWLRLSPFVRKTSLNRADQGVGARADVVARA